MNIDRKWQREILTALAENFGKDEPGHGAYETLFEHDKEKFVANALYLEGHGLIESGLMETSNGYRKQRDARITERGIDFLLDDGGLSAILGVVTIKLHQDTLRDLIEARIEASNATEAEKNKLISHLRSLPIDAAKAATTQVAVEALKQIPNIVPLLSKLLGL